MPPFLTSRPCTRCGESTGSTIVTVCRACYADDWAWFDAEREKELAWADEQIARKMKEAV